MLKQEVFPIKDSYVAYLKKDPPALSRNPRTCQRLIGALRSMGIDEIIDKTTAPKEANRQMGPLFKNWINSADIGFNVTNNPDNFMQSTEDMIFNSSDSDMEYLAKSYLGYKRDKGLDFICRSNNTYIIGEAKFLTDFGGHQTTQFDDAIATLTTRLKKKRNIM